MGLDTNFNQDPYYDDFDASKKFHRILFKPSVAVQARELTQLQTIIQDQVERFGDNILKEGTIVRGCNFTFLDSLPYVKILDLQLDGQPVVMSSYDGARAVGLTSGAEAFVVTVKTGLESQSPDLNTLYIRYVKSGSSNKTFTTTENIRIENFETGAVIATVTAAGTVSGESSTAIGNGYAVKVGDGIIYQKGAFVSVDEQLVVVDRYSTEPNDAAVGFVTNETIVNSSTDTSLKSNAQGYPNANGDGADRVKLDPTLTVKTISAANADENFFTLLEYQNGGIVRRKETTQYSAIGDSMARRTAEESGNYTIENFPLSIEAGSNSDYLVARVGAGLAYVDGRRVETVGTVNVNIDAATTYNTEQDQNITTNLGHYIIVDEVIGDFVTNQYSEIELWDTAQNRVTAGSLTSSPTGSQIGTAKIRALVHESGVRDVAATQYRLYLFDIRMTGNNKFEDVEFIFYDGTVDGNADVVLENGKAIIKESTFKRALWNVGRPAIKSIPSANADFVYRTVDNSLSTNSTGGMVITLSSGEWTYGATATLNDTQKSDFVIINTSTGQHMNTDSTTMTTDGAGTTMTITGLPFNSVSAIAHYNVKKTAAAPAEKQTANVYVKIQANTNPGGTTGTYSLGLPDVYDIIGVYQTTNGTYSESGTDVTSSFTLVPNQKDAYYDLSYVTKSRSLTIGADDTLLFKVKVFTENNTGSFGDGYFSVDSYTGIDMEDIPTYTSERGVVYDLRNVVDFRPYCSNTVDASTTIGSANVANVAVGAAPSFPASESFVAAPNENMEVDYEYYLGRQDRLFVDDYGRFQVIEGIPAEEPTIPAPPARGMTLATIYVPPFPSLTSLAANRAGKPDYATKMSPQNIAGYTMADIGRIDRRVKQLEYYTVLSALETEAKDYQILDSSGNNRFKNGILVDPFEDLSIGDVKSGQFSAAIDPAYKELTPKVRQFDIDLTVANTSNATDFGDVITLAKTDVTMIDQPYATTTRNAVSDFYKYDGTAFIDPNYDAGHDVTTAPDYNLDIDLTTPFVDFAEGLNEFVPLQQVDRAVASRTERIFDPDRLLIRTTRTASETVRQLQVGLGSETTTKVGDFVTDVRFNPFMRSREVKVVVRGMRPSTTMYAFFDGQGVATHVAPAVVGDSSQGMVKGIRRSRAYGSAIASDANGVVRLVFRIPANTFFVGTRLLEIMDLSDYSLKENAISYSKIAYNAFNYSVDKRALSISTRMPEIDFTSTTATTVTTTELSIPTQTTFNDIGFDVGGDGANPDGPGDDPNGAEDGHSDPIAQTFMIKRGHAGGDNVIYVPKIDLFFQQKPAANVNGVTVMIRETVNGFPASKIVPFGKVHLEPSEVTVNATAGQATTVTFDAPLALKTNQEYSVVVRPDGNDPDYRLWVAKTGGTDVTQSIKITQDVNDGTLFTSTNDRAWTPHQDENLKYKLYRANFTSTSGTVTLTNKNSEYFNVNTVTGTFQTDEYVFVNAAPVSAQTIAVSAGNNEIVGTSTTFSSYFNAGDHVIIAANSTVYDVCEIDAVTNNTHMTTKDIPKYTNATATFWNSIVGTVSHFDSTDPAILYLDNSTAESGTVFAAGDDLISESGATAQIESVENKNVSFVAPNIYRTNSTMTKTTMTAPRLFRDDTNANYTLSSVEFNNYTFLNQRSTVIKSRSNEITDGDGDRSFALRVALTNVSSGNNIYSTPVIDSQTATCKIFEYIINGDASDEDGVDGAASSRYVTKVVTLADGLDAEDLKIFLTAYRPAGTTINVYGKFLSDSDPDDFNSKSWTLMTAKSSNPISQNANRFDFLEHEFNLPTTEVAGQAFLNSSGVFEYNDGASKYNSYKYFAVKIVLLNDNGDHHRVPRVRDMRGIALAA